MAMVRCPRCFERVAYQKYIEDFVHQCSSGKTQLDQEDVINIANDASGNTNPWNFSAATNKVFGTTAAIEGEHVNALTERGKPSEVFTPKQRFQSIDLKGRKR